MRASQKAQLTEGPLGKTLVNFTIPMIFGSLGAIVFNLADTYFVGQLGKNELAAMSFTFPVVMIIMSVALGIGIGASVTISRAIGEGNQQKVQRLTTDSLTLALLVVIAFVITGMLTINPLFRFLGATDEILPLIREYMIIWYPGMIALVIPMVGNNIIRATGDTKTPSMVMLVAAVVNVILDPFLIFGLGPFPRLELAGAAIATVCARTTTLCVAIWVLYYRDRLISFVVPKFQEILESWKQILFIGLPMVGTNILTPLGIGMVTKLVAYYGPVAVAAFGVSTRIEAFALMVFMALGSALSPFIGQNLGAKKFDRVALSVKYSQQFTLGWGLLMYLILAISGKYIASVFSSDPKIIHTVMIYFWIIPASYGMQGVLRVVSTVLTVLKKPIHASILMLIHTFVILVPLAYLGSRLFELKGIFGAVVVAYFIAATIGYFVQRKYLVEGKLQENTR